METNYLSIKQHRQLISFATRTRSYIVPDELPIIKLMEKCAIYCLQIRINGCNFSKAFIEDLDKIINRYYPYGYRANRGFYDNEQRKPIYNLECVRFTVGIFPSKVRSIEKVLFVRALRACYKFLISEHTEKDKFNLIDSLEQIRVLALG